MLTISLKDIKFFAYHGLYEEEKKNGNFFEIDIIMKLHFNAEKQTPFLDYAEAYNIVKKAFEIRTDLLETLVSEIHHLLKQKFPQTTCITVKVRKLNPPLAGEVAYAEVRLER